LKLATITSAQGNRASSRRKLNITKLKRAVRVLCRNAVSGTMRWNELLVNNRRILISNFVSFDITYWSRRSLDVYKPVGFERAGAEAFREQQ
jgi:hypothetical protein